VSAIARLAAAAAVAAVVVVVLCFLSAFGVSGGDALNWAIGFVWLLW
jgi:hypothetical protein